jgi:hypothetical protein
LTKGKKMKLLNVDANAKTIKGRKRGYLTAVLYLAPYIISGSNLCPFAKIAGCWRTCLNVSGRAEISKGNKKRIENGIELPDNFIQLARIRRTRMWLDDREAFLRQLDKEIQALLRKAKREDLIPTVRLNGTSDIRWEDVLIDDQTFFDRYSDLQFYDYTKDYPRLDTELPSNYHLTLSYSEANDKYRAKCWDYHARKGVNLAVVAQDKAIKARLIDKFNGVDGDAHDLRFLDPPGSFIVLKAKANAKYETNGFVCREI